jgi:hypothetical protein
MNSIRKAAAGAAIVATAVAGGAIGASLLGSAGAQTAGGSSTTAPAPSGGAPGGQFDPTQGGHVGQNGQKEVLLTGDTADKVKAAAQAAVPGATIERVETDAEGSPYEAHMVKSDGTHVTVKVDNNYKVTNIENDGAGFGPGHGGPGGPPPQSGGTPPTTTN